MNRKDAKNAKFIHHKGIAFFDLAMPDLDAVRLP
jgi:hypothetical protein